MALGLLMFVLVAEVAADDAGDDKAFMTRCMADNDCAGKWGPNCRAATHSNQWRSPQKELDAARAKARNCIGKWDVCARDIKFTLDERYLTYWTSEIRKLLARNNAVGNVCSRGSFFTHIDFEQLAFFCWDLGANQERCLKQIDDAFALTNDLINLDPCVWEAEFRQFGEKNRRAREEVCVKEQRSLRDKRADDRRRQADREREQREQVRRTERELSRRASEASRPTPGSSYLQRKLEQNRRTNELIAQGVAEVGDIVTRHIEESRRRREEERDQERQRDERRRQQERERREQEEREMIRRANEFEDYWREQQRRTPGRLAITSNPTNASIMIGIIHPDGDPSGQFLLMGTRQETEGLTPVDRRVPPGRYRISIEQDGFESFLDEVVVTEDQTRDVEVTLKLRRPRVRVAGWGAFQHSHKVEFPDANATLSKELWEVDHGERVAVISATGCVQELRFAAVAGGTVDLNADCEPTLSNLVASKSVRSWGRNTGALGIGMGVDQDGPRYELGYHRWSFAIGGVGDRHARLDELQDVETWRRYGIRYTPHLLDRPISARTRAYLGLGIGISTDIVDDFDRAEFLILPELSLHAGVEFRFSDSIQLVGALTFNSSALSDQIADDSGSDWGRDRHIFGASIAVQFGRFSATNERPQRRPGGLEAVGKVQLPPTVVDFDPSAPTKPAAERPAPSPEKLVSEIETTLRPCDKAPADGATVVVFPNDKEPNAEVWVDGSLVQTGAGQVELSAGEHDIAFVHRSFPAIRDKLTITAGSCVMVKLTKLNAI